MKKNNIKLKQEVMKSRKAVSPEDVWQKLDELEQDLV